MAGKLHPDPRRGHPRDRPLRRDNASDWIFEGAATKEECRPPHIRGNPQGSQDVKVDPPEKQRPRTLMGGPF